MTTLEYNLYESFDNITDCSGNYVDSSGNTVDCSGNIVINANTITTDPSNNTITTEDILGPVDCFVQAIDILKQNMRADDVFSSIAT